jgi:hypothetical protein
MIHTPCTHPHIHARDLSPSFSFSPPFYPQRSLLYIARTIYPFSVFLRLSSCHTRRCGVGKKKLNFLRLMEKGPTRKFSSILIITPHYQQKEEKKEKKSRENKQQRDESNRITSALVRTYPQSLHLPTPVLQKKKLHISI